MIMLVHAVMIMLVMIMARQAAICSIYV